MLVRKVLPVKVSTGVGRLVYVAAWRLPDEQLDLSLDQVAQGYQWQFADLLHEAGVAATGEIRWATKSRLWRGEPIVDLLAEVDVEPWTDPIAPASPARSSRRKKAVPA